MADTITTNFHWIKPEISGSPTTWGVKLNADLDNIDAQLFTTDTNATQAVHDSMQIGMVVMFAGATPPDNWKLCDGTVYDNTDIPLLAPVLNNAFGGVAGVSNAVPDMRIAFPVGTGTITGGYFGDPSATMGLGETGGEPWHQLTIAELASHDHDDVGHLHDINDPTHDHQWFSTSYSLQGAAPGAGDDISIPTGSGALIGGTENNSTGITGTQAGFADLANTGNDEPHNNMPPYIGMNFIIKFQ